jgi:hypothetical protein
MYLLLIDIGPFIVVTALEKLLFIPKPYLFVRFLLVLLPVAQNIVVSSVPLDVADLSLDTSSFKDFYGIWDPL